MFKSITLEMSLKPFKKTDDAYIKNICIEVFEQWKPLIKNTDEISIMFFSGDGSELLDYTGNLDDAFEWGYFIGNANPPESVSWDPEKRSLHSKPELYMENPPKMTYRILKNIVDTLKITGKEILGNDKTILVGTTFDIGPEFAISDFKYKRHTEIIMGNAMGGKCFVNSIGILKGDNYHYAGYKDGIPDGTPFPCFLGRQTKFFAKDIGFDYLWLSNGVGFSFMPWSTEGVIFDGSEFKAEKIRSERETSLNFWKLFRSECPDLLIKTRGTNYSTGIDYATDAVPLYDIYKGGFNIMPPCNSPWAAINGNFGLELMGQMARNSEIPNNRYMFRYYLHDPWWINSPWYDRYEGQPHDIYLPLATGRIDENGKVQKPTDLHILTIDNSWGDLPDLCAFESIPHIKKAEKDAPDKPSPFVWVYPFKEYTSTNEKHVLNEMFTNDWFITNAINNAFPLSTVVTTDNFIKTDKKIYSESILISPVPHKNSDYEKEILNYVKSGGKVIFYGSVTYASEEFKKLVNVKVTDCVSGVAEIEKVNIPDKCIFEEIPKCLKINPLECNGGLDTEILNPASSVKEVVRAGGKTVATFGGNFAWFKTIMGSELKKENSLLVQQNPEEFFIGENILRYILSEFGYEIKLEKPYNKTKSPVIMIARSDNGFMLSSYMPSTRVKVSLKTPYGAPILLGYETRIENGCSSYNFPRAEHRECRIFVEQAESSEIVCKEDTPQKTSTRRRIHLSGLKNATVRFFPETYAIGNSEILLNPDPTKYTSEEFEMKWKETYAEIKNVTGEMSFAMYKKI